MGKEFIKNCLNCARLNVEYPYEMTTYGAFNYCEESKGKDNLKSFPFKSEQKCNTPNFWAILEIDEALSKIYDEEMKHDDMETPRAIKYFKDNYLKGE